MWLSDARSQIIDSHITETERPLGWQPCYSLETLKLVDNVSIEYQGCHPDDLSVSVYINLVCPEFSVSAREGLIFMSICDNVFVIKTINQSSSNFKVNICMRNKHHWIKLLNEIRCTWLFASNYNIRKKSWILYWIWLAIRGITRIYVVFVLLFFNHIDINENVCNVWTDQLDQLGCSKMLIEGKSLRMTHVWCVYTIACIEVICFDILIMNCYVNLVCSEFLYYIKRIHFIYLKSLLGSWCLK